MERTSSTETRFESLRAILKPPAIEGQESYGIPPEPDAECDPDLEAKFENWMNLKLNGMHFNTRLTKTHAFRNPSIMSKMIEFQGLDEYGSNFPKDMFDPHGFPPEAFVDELEKAQRTRAERAAAAAIAGIPVQTASGSTLNIKEAAEVARQRAIQFMSAANQQPKNSPGVGSVGMYLPANQHAAPGSAISTAGSKRSKWDSTESKR
ncbi:hypothetical protein SmJEL517_g00724 [Synchytrium microbalum]|uniref:HCNGP-like protein n=1 Tax=Synchytrium microbalum TaxID=1806994 RepID=A0A507CIL1_9FUNG|nr:uncharacterized protein SmJEL517_g00724 [Synchytrium microbalum]TPX37503.1 hypothetical protein SmJEL517_g00724 [Synchytrium microbalum]